MNKEYELELSVVLPCLNEEKAIGVCIEKIIKVFQQENISGEIIVVDNGSTDKSVEIVRKNYPEVKLLFEKEKGYGAALRRGIESAKGKYILMGDADDSYDFLEIPKFLKFLREGYELVMGSRFKGKILPGAMSWSHRYIGNPILSGILRLFFGGEISDSHCGLRAFSKQAYEKMSLHTTGMEFASEMIIHSLKKKLKIIEVPITYYPRKGESKLKEFRDAWRHLRFMLIYSPGYVFVLPGLVIFVLNFLLTIKLVFGDVYFAGRNWGIHLMVFSSMFTLFGWQLLNLGLAAKSFAQSIFSEDSKFFYRLSRIINLERSIIFGFSLVFLGVCVIVYIFYVWWKNNFGPLTEVKTALLSLTLLIMGLQTIFTAFLTSMTQIKYK